MKPVSSEPRAIAAVASTPPPAVTHGVDSVQRSALPDGDFKRELATLLPHLRAFGRSLCGNPDLADDLVQETMLKAWKNRTSFVAGTAMKSWAFVILRNTYLSQLRRGKFTGDYDDAVAERLLIAREEQSGQLDLADLQRALLQLPLDQREALVLVGAGGMSYEDVAEICNCAVGTIKSRVSRGRVALAQILESGQLDQARKGSASGADAFVAIMAEVDSLSGK